MQPPVRLTSRERLLAALEGAVGHLSEYEFPRRYSQPGLVSRLSMAQSHVSRAVKGLESEGLIEHERRRVSGQRRRVMVYLLSAAGRTAVEELRAALLACMVYSPNAEGELQRSSVQELLLEWEQSHRPVPADTFEMLELLRTADEHGGLPIIEPASDAMESAGPADLSSEAIGLHIELAGLRVDAGDAVTAANHLLRAADLHRRRGDQRGELRCLAALSCFGAADEQRMRMLELVRALSATQDTRLNLMLHDALWNLDEGVARGLLDATEPQGESVHEVRLRRLRWLLEDGASPDMDSIPIQIYEDGLRALLWSAQRLALEFLAARGHGKDWPEVSRIEDLLSSLCDSRQAILTSTSAELVMEAIEHPLCSTEQQRDWLDRVWACKPPWPLLGHIGFRLAAVSGRDQSREVLEQLRAAFDAAADDAGREVCESLLASSDES